MARINPLRSQRVVLPHVKNSEKSDTRNTDATHAHSPTACIASYRGNIADHLYNCAASQFSEQEIVVLVAFAGRMIATNVFNNVMETDIDEYLFDYVPPLNYA